MDQSTVHPPETMTRVSAAPPETVPIWNASVDAECVVPDADLADAKHLVGIKPEKNAIACPELANHLSVNGLPDAHDHVTIPVMENATEFSAGKGAGLNPGVCFNFGVDVTVFKTQLPLWFRWCSCTAESAVASAQLRFRERSCVTCVTCDVNLQYFSNDMFLL